MVAVSAPTTRALNTANTVANADGAANVTTNATANANTDANTNATSNTNALNISLQRADRTCTMARTVAMGGCRCMGRLLLRLVVLLLVL